MISFTYKLNFYNLFITIIRKKKINATEKNFLELKIEIFQWFDLCIALLLFSETANDSYYNWWHLGKI